MNKLSIRQASELTGFSSDTLRYYEKLGLIGPVPRSASGQRRYGEKELSQLRFIQRARKMQFSLDEIAQLMALRRQPLQVQQEVRTLTAAKLAQIEETLQALTHLRDELQLLLNLCPGNDNGQCPIIEELEKKDGPGA